eukprot:9286667-Pyramimonas_sp.AAC.1
MRSGLSCNAEDHANGKGRAYNHACPYLPGDGRIRSGTRHDAEIAVFLSLPRMLEDGIKVYQSEND